MILLASTLMRGTALSGTGGVWRVLGADGLTYDCALGRGIKQGGLKLAVGDEVELEPVTAGATSSPKSIRGARSWRDESRAGRGERIIAANVDQVVVVFALVKPTPHPRMLDRFLVIAEANSLAARLVVNKVSPPCAGQRRETAQERAGGRADATARLAGWGTG